MLNLIKRLVTKAKNFNAFDYAMLKLALLSAGILIGYYLSSFVAHIMWIIWIIFAITYSYLSFIFFRRGEK